MTLFTSYYAKTGITPCTVAISQTIPEWYTGRRIRYLAPNQSILWEYKAGMLSWEEYTSRYLQQLEDIGYEKIISELREGDILLCYEKSEARCHRHILAEWLKQHGQVVTEK